MKTLLLIFFSFIATSLFSQFVLNGDAISLGGDCYQLTEETTFSAGSVWYETLISLDEDFDISFSINLGDLDATGADGVYFVLQPLATDLGAAGGGMGYEGITPSVGVEFDTYQNGIYTDPTYDHIAITSNGSLDHAAATNLDGPTQIIMGTPNAEDGDDHEVRIIWNATTQTLSAYIDCDLRVSYTGDIINDVFDGDPEVYFGFTGGTGSYYNYQVVSFNYTTEIDALDDVAICPGDTVQLILPEGFTSYEWLPNENISDNSVHNPFVYPNETTEYTVVITDACGLEIFDTVIVTVGDLEFVDLGPDVTICEGQLWTFNAYVPDGIYLWNDGSTLPTLTIDENGTFWVVVVDGACIDSDTVTATFVPAPDITFPEDTTICGLGTEFIIDATTPGATYTWHDGSHESTFTVTTDGLYYVTVYIGGCNDKDSILVSYSTAPEVNIGPDFTICPSTQIIVSTGTSGFEYEWQDGSSGSSYTVTDEGIYWVDVTVNGCTTRDSVVVTPDPCICIVAVPDAFSPNSDGVNDEFKQIDCDYLSQYLLTVYNRWGEIVFQTTNHADGWDGNLEGKECDLGTYVYAISFTRLTGESGFLQGNVTLVR